MNIALIADIHGNAIALDAALADIDRGSPDHILCLGDVAAGPQPLACLRALRKREIPCVLGNADVELLEPEREAPSGDAERDELMAKVHDITLWCSQQLSEADRAFVHSFHAIIDVPLGDAHRLLCFHGTPESNIDILSATTPDDEVAPLLAGHEHITIFAGGHTHQPLLRRWRDALILNPGSIGLGYQFDRVTSKPYNLARAQYAWIRVEGEHVNIELRQVAVEHNELIESILESGMPHSKWYSEDWR